MRLFSSRRQIPRLLMAIRFLTAFQKITNVNGIILSQLSPLLGPRHPFASNVVVKRAIISGMLRKPVINAIQFRSEVNSSIWRDTPRVT